MNPVFLKSSTGFVLPYNDKYQTLLSDGSDQVHDVMKHIQFHSMTSFGTRSLILELAKAFFDVGALPILNGSVRGLRNFLIIQYQEGESNGLTWLHYQFLLDTVQFIRTGYRRVSSASVRNLLSTQQQGLQSRRSTANNTQRVALREKLRQVIHNLTPEEDVDFLSLWVNQPSGMTDLLLALYVLFGRTDAEEHLLGGYI